MGSSVYAWLVMLAVGQLPAAPAPSNADVAAAISRLGDERFSAREQATEQLWHWGDASEAPLREALKNPDAEIRIRAKTILDRFSLGIYPDTPGESTAAIREYRSGPQQQKMMAVQKLKNLQDWRTLGRLERNETDAAVRNQITIALRGDLLKRVTASIESGDIAEAERMLRMESAIADPLVQRQLVTIYCLRGDLKTQIAAQQAELAKTPDDGRQRFLMNLLEASGDYATANALLAKISGKNLPPLINVAVQQHDWKKAAELMDEMIATNASENNVGRAHSAMYHRLAGNADRADERLNEAIAASTSDPMYVHKLLLLHERIDDAIDGLIKTRPSMAFELHSLRHSFDKAFAIADVRVGRTYDEAWFDALPPGDVPMADAEQQANRRHVMALQSAYFLHQLGEKKDADAIFSLLRSLERPGSVNSIRWRRAELCRIEMRLGLDDEPFHDAAKYLTANGDTQIIALLFGKQGAIATHWYETVQAALPEESVNGSLANVRMLLRPKPDEKKSDGWRKLVDSALASLPEEKAAPRFQRVEALAEAYVAHGDRQAAAELLARENLSSLLYLRGGDLLREDKDFAAANAIYAKIGPADTHRALGLYMQGVCEAEQGNADAGQRLKEQAVLLALDNPARTLLFQGMTARRLLEDANYLRDLWTRTSPELSPLLAKEYGDALAESDPAAAAAHWDTVLLRLTSASASLTEDAGYVVLTHAIHRARMKAALAASNKEDFERELAACLRLLPYAWEMIDDIIPKMDAAGWKAEADALFDEQLAKLTALAKQHPDSPRFSNAIAWISATCRRDLDQALAQAERTMKLAPDNPSYLDTLAEVHFARGNVELAIATQRRVIELSPAPLFKERLEKFEAAGKEKAP